MHAHVDIQYVIDDYATMRLYLSMCDPRHSQVINPKFPPSFSYYVCLFLPSLAFFAPPRYHQYKYCLQTAQTVHIYCLPIGYPLPKDDEQQDFLPSTAYIIGTNYMPNCQPTRT